MFLILYHFNEPFYASVTNWKFCYKKSSETMRLPIPADYISYTYHVQYVYLYIQQAIPPGEPNVHTE